MTSIQLASSMAALAQREYEAGVTSHELYRRAAEQEQSRIVTAPYTRLVAALLHTLEQAPVTV